MENYQLLVDNMAKQREEKDVKLVLNLFQTLLDEFARSYVKKEETEHPKVWCCLSLGDLCQNCRCSCEFEWGLSALDGQMGWISLSRQPIPAELQLLPPTRFWCLHPVLVALCPVTYACFVQPPLSKTLNSSSWRTVTSACRMRWLSGQRGINQGLGKRELCERGQRSDKGNKQELQVIVG